MAKICKRVNEVEELKRHNLKPTLKKNMKISIFDKIKSKAPPLYPGIELEEMEKLND